MTTHYTPANEGDAPRIGARSTQLEIPYYTHYVGPAAGRLVFTLADNGVILYLDRLEGEPKGFTMGTVPLSELCIKIAGLQAMLREFSDLLDKPQQIGYDGSNADNSA